VKDRGGDMKGGGGVKDRGGDMKGGGG
jgi:hypothetical protein